MAVFSLATTDKGYTKQDGTVIPDKTEWHNIVIFGRIAEVVEKYVHKGSSLFVQGKIRTRAYDGKDGIKRYATEIIAEQMQMLDRKDSSSQQQQQQQFNQPMQTPPPPKSDDDLPF